MQIAFIVGHYGKPESMRTCLYSLLDQTEPNIGIVVSDNTPNRQESRLNDIFCSELGPRVFYAWTAPYTVIDMPHVRHKQCLYTALEVGAAQISADWLCFAGSDAYFAPVFAERMLLLAKEQPELEFIHSDVVLGGPRHGYFTLGTRPANCAIDLQSFIVKRSWFEGFPHKHEHYELADGFLVESLVARGIKHAHLAQVLSVKN